MRGIKYNSIFGNTVIFAIIMDKSGAINNKNDIGIHTRCYKKNKIHFAKIPLLFLSNSYIIIFTSHSIF